MNPSSDHKVLDPVSRHYGFRKRPFENDYDADFFFHGPDHQEALNRLQYIVAEPDMPIGMLVGAVGTGKTFVSRMLEKRLDARRHQVVRLNQCQYQFGYIVSGILEQVNMCRLETHDASFENLRMLHAVLLEKIVARGMHLVVILDDAQMLTAESLELLRNLLHLDERLYGCLTILLIGQSELAGHVAQLPPLLQRIALPARLGRLDGDDVRRFMLHRIQAAGHPTARIFSRSAVQEIARISGGLPRRVNQLAKLSLVQAYNHGLPHVLEEQVLALEDDVRCGLSA